jgi:hypothetical protein
MTAQRNGSGPPDKELQATMNKTYHETMILLVVIMAPAGGAAPTAPEGYACMPVGTHPLLIVMGVGNHVPEHGMALTRRGDTAVVIRVIIGYRVVEKALYGDF